MAKVIVPFRDRHTWVAYRVGDDYDGPPERVRALQEGGFVESGPNVRDADETVQSGVATALKDGLDTLSVAELRALAKERGLAVPSRVSKKRLVEMLGA
jgi:hypothetical protein